MIKKMIFKKVIIATLALISLSLIYIFSDNNELNIKEKLEYVDNEVVLHDIFLLDSNNYIALTKVVVEEKEIEPLAKELLEVLIKDGKGEAKIPNGFKSIIPNNTEIKSVVFNESVLKIDFNENLLDVPKELEEKVLESIIYTMTSIKGIEKVLIYINGKILSKLPKTNKILPSTFDRTYGINKIYNITSPNNVTGITVYYINKYNDNYYYVPVTNYINDNQNKISIIIEELRNNDIYNKDLMSFLNHQTKLLSSKIEDNTMILEFSDDILIDSITNEITKEVIDTITLSIKDNYEVDQVIFNIQNKNF